VFDGDVLPGDQYELYRAKHFNDTPILIGTNTHELSLFLYGDPKIGKGTLFQISLPVVR